MKVKHWSSSDTKEMSIKEILEYEVSSTSSERGALEDTQVQVAKLTEIIGVIAGHLPYHAQRHVVESTCFYWTVVDEEQP